MSKMRILYINPAGGLGGAERSLLSMLSALAESAPPATALRAPELDLHLIVTADGPLREYAKQLGVSVKLLPLPTELATIGDSRLSLFGSNLKPIYLLFQSAKSLLSLWKYTRKLQKAIQIIQPDIIHSNGFKTHLLTTIANANVPIIWHIHDFVSSRRVVSYLLRFCSGKVSLAIANSQAVGEDFKQLIPRIPVEVIYNAIDVEYFSPGHIKGQILDDLAGLPPAPANTIRIGLIATFARWKGQDVFLEAASLVLKRQLNSPIRFYIIGGAIYQTQGSQFSLTELQNQATSLNIDRQVGFIDFQENIADIYRALDIVVHASTQPEPFGLTIIEAMACGKPTIVSVAGGAAELFTHNHDAIGVAPGKAIALADAIQDLVDNPQLRQHLSENARGTVLKRFSHNRLGEQILTSYI